MSDHYSGEDPGTGCSELLLGLSVIVFAIILAVLLVLDWVGR